MSVDVKLTDVEMRIACTVGFERRVDSKGSGMGDKFGFDPNKQDAWATDIEGAAAEMAFCKSRGRYWDGSVRSFKNADAGSNIQIRHTQREDGCLIVRDRDNSEHYYVLIVGIAPHFRIVGWMKGCEAKSDEFARDPGQRYPAYFIPQNRLHGIKEGK